MKRQALRWGMPALLAALAIALPGQHASAVEAVFCSEDEPPAADTVIMLATSWCPYCAKARKFLHARGVDYCEYDIEQSPTGDALHQRSGKRGVPVILIDGRVIGGYDPDEISLALKRREQRRGARPPAGV